MVTFESSTVPDARAAAVLLHPHPEFGGNRFNIVIEALYRALPAAGVTAVRFDFSSADLTEAAAEAVEALRESGTRPLVLAGYSFGADVAASIADPRLAGWLLVAPPLRMLPVDAFEAGRDQRPTRVLVPEHDQFSPPARTVPAIKDWVNTTVDVVPGADHFLAGATDVVVAEALDWVEQIVTAQA